MIQQWGNSRERNGVERRESPRYACNIPAVLRKGKTRHQCTITNISMGGVEIRLDHKVKVEEFIVDFKLNDMVLSIYCEAVAIRENENSELILHTKFLIIPTEVRKYFTDLLVASEIKFRPILNANNVLRIK
ncbi:PilZ domain-containing protein [Sporanaerobium hydrogeniformans]|uniref:PilZ domain-containing protein n=1 Tax=Sporanaerobium hydrogeniformans TaxID=3072179 RepID=UPI0015D48CC0|nr:PilZ domain-containing protein [Sporanaerobium hydrogeniformans]